MWDKRPDLDLESFETGKPSRVTGTVCYTDGSQVDPRDVSGQLIIPEDELDDRPAFDIHPTGEANVGFGFVIKSPNEPPTMKWGNIGPQATVFQGEIYAIQKAAEHLRIMGGMTLFIFMWIVKLL